MSGLFVGQLVESSFRYGDDVVDNVAAWVWVGEVVVDLTAADAAGWGVTRDGFAVAVADGGVAVRVHGSAGVEGGAEAAAVHVGAVFAVVLFLFGVGVGDVLQVVVGHAS